MPAFRDLTNQVFGRLIVLRRSGRARGAIKKGNLHPFLQLIAVTIILIRVLLAGGSDQCQFAPYRDDAQSA